MTTHGLKATMISLLISSGYSDATVVLQSGHRDNSCLQSYHNLGGQNGRDQFAVVFGGYVRRKRGARDIDSLNGSRESYPETVDGELQNAASAERTQTYHSDFDDCITRSLSSGVNANNCTFYITINRQ